LPADHKIRPDRCETCRFWDAEERELYLDYGRRAACHRYPLSTTSSPTFEWWWCGEWQAVREN